MKNTKQCPKCGSPHIVRIDGSVGAYGSGNNVCTGSTVFSGVNLNQYICCSCGYVEAWIDEEDLGKVWNSKKAKRI